MQCSTIPLWIVLCFVMSRSVMSCHVMSFALHYYLQHVHTHVWTYLRRLLVRAVGLLQCEEDVERLLLENVGNDFKKGLPKDSSFFIYLFLFFLSSFWSSLFALFLSFLSSFFPLTSIHLSIYFFASFFSFFPPSFLPFYLPSFFHSFLPAFPLFYPHIFLPWMQVCVTSELPARLGKLRADTDPGPAIPMIKPQTHR